MGKKMPEQSPNRKHDVCPIRPDSQTEDGAKPHDSLPAAEGR